MRKFYKDNCYEMIDEPTPHDIENCTECGYELLTTTIEQINFEIIYCRKCGSLYYYDMKMNKWFIFIPKKCKG